MKAPKIAKTFRIEEELVTDFYRACRLMKKKKTKGIEEAIELWLSLHDRQLYDLIDIDGGQVTELLE